LIENLQGTELGLAVAGGATNGLTVVRVELFDPIVVKFKLTLNVLVVDVSVGSSVVVSNSFSVSSVSSCDAIFNGVLKDLNDGLSSISVISPKADPSSPSRMLLLFSSSSSCCIREIATLLNFEILFDGCVSDSL
jgi:hypothetical protein